jgi:hypothetical protein
MIQNSVRHKDLQSAENGLLARKHSNRAGKKPALQKMRENNDSQEGSKKRYKPSK